MESLGRVRLLRCFLLVASFTLSCMQVHVHHRRAAFAFAFAASTFAAPRRGAAATPTPAFLSTKVELLHRSRFAKHEVFNSELLRAADLHRITGIYTKLHRLHRAAPTDESVSQQSSTQIPLYSGETIGGANYIVKVGLGTPAKELNLAIDTGSSLSWTQCLPCGLCYSQHDPVFDPSASSSYQKVPCGSPQCAKLSSSSGSCSTTKATSCDYAILYLDGSLTFGDFALDALTVGDRLVSAAFPIGCGHVNEGILYGVDGLLGLSRDSIAFPAQTKGVFGEVFAYCMPPISSSLAGYMEFGAPGGGVSTPLITALSTSELYAVELESVNVEGKTSPSKTITSKAMVVVDSGTVITRLDSPLYVQVRDAFKKASSSLKKASPKAGMGFLESCYTVSNVNLFPSVTLTFKGGLALTLAPQNLVISLDKKEDYCLALLPINSTSGISILGNYQQQGHLFTFDIAHSTLSITSNAC